MKILHRKQAGDTLVEVLLATVIMSVVISSAYALANRSTRFNQAAFERSEVTNMLQQQAEYLRAVRSSDKEAWDDVWSRTVTSGPTYTQTQCASETNFAGINPSNAFYMTETGSSPVEIQSQTGVLRPANKPNYTIWIRAKLISPTIDVADFTIHGCWPGLGSDANNYSALVLRLEREGS